MSVPDPTNPYPLPDYPRYCVFLKPTITSEKVTIAEIARAIPRRGGTHP